MKFTKKPRRGVGTAPRRSHWAAFLTLALSSVLGTSPSQAQVQGTTASRATPVTGVIERFTIADAASRWSQGTVTVGGQVVILPKNLIITLPANWLTLQQLYAQRPVGCPASETGLAKTDTCTGATAGASNGVGAFASILANRRADGQLIAGEVRIDKGQESLSDAVTFVSFHDGYMRVGGTAGQDVGGVMVRLNDPAGVHTVQAGLGCLAGSSNCSADVRFTNDPTNYTFSFTTGYPACLPSETTGVGGRVAGVPAGSLTGAGDPFCPDTNRTAAGTLVANSTRFAPVKVGDYIVAEGNYESIGGQRFLSAHTIEVKRGLTTQDLPTQPDYMKWVEVEWDTGGFQNQRVRTLLIGRTTLSNPGVDVYALDVTPQDNSNRERLMASTVGCDAAGGAGTCTNQGIGATTGGIFKIRHDVDFLFGVTPRLSPCDHIVLSGRPAAEIGATTCAAPAGQNSLAQEFGAIVPITRELIGRSRHKATLNAGVVTLDILGREASNGEYLTPVGVGFPEFDEINLDGLATPYNFEAQPWNLDRRLGPVGCIDAASCGAARAPLDPFPCSGLDPRTQAPVPVGAENRILTAVADGASLLPLPSAVCTFVAGGPPPVDPPAVDTTDILITAAQYRRTKTEFRVTGTAAINETLSIDLVRGGIVVANIGTAQTDIAGAYALNVRGSPLAVQNGDSVRVRSIARVGEPAANLVLTIRN